MITNFKQLKGVIKRVLSFVLMLCMLVVSFPFSTFIVSADDFYNGETNELLMNFGEDPDLSSPLILNQLNTAYIETFPEEKDFYLIDITAEISSAFRETFENEKWVINAEYKVLYSDGDDMPDFTPIQSGSFPLSADIPNFSIKYIIDNVTLTHSGAYGVEVNFKVCDELGETLQENKCFSQLTVLSVIPPFTVFGVAPQNFPTIITANLGDNVDVFDLTVSIPTTPVNYLNIITNPSWKITNPHGMEVLTGSFDMDGISVVEYTRNNISSADVGSYVLMAYYVDVDGIICGIEIATVNVELSLPEITGASASFEHQHENNTVESINLLKENRTLTTNITVNYVASPKSAILTLDATNESEPNITIQWLRNGAVFDGNGGIQHFTLEQFGINPYDLGSQTGEMLMNLPLTDLEKGVNDGIYTLQVFIAGNDTPIGISHALAVNVLSAGDFWYNEWLSGDVDIGSPNIALIPTESYRRENKRDDRCQFYSLRF